MTDLKSHSLAAILLTFLLVMASTATAQNFQSLFVFNGFDGRNPVAGLVQGTDGNFYGMTPAGGSGSQSGNGTVFQVDASGDLNTIYNFCVEAGCSGIDPLGGLVEATNQNFYGTTHQGGANGLGTIFEISPGGSLTTLYNFCTQDGCTDGILPRAGLTLGADRKFYGTTNQDGANGGGTIFKVTAQGQLKVLYSFCSLSGCADGSSPSANLVQATNGDFYGVTPEGGTGEEGTIFKVTPSGELTTLYSFCSETNCTDGSTPMGLMQAANGIFYGTTAAGGANGFGAVFSITAEGKFRKLYSFCSETNCYDGGVPLAGLIQATDGNFYGTTSQGGAYGGGTVFQFHSTDRYLGVIHSFCTQGGCFDGNAPAGVLMQATSGDIYGTTSEGGSAACLLTGCGTIFYLSGGFLTKFVETLPIAGKVGAEVQVLGTDLTGATGVTFDGVSAEFTVKSPYLITANVPAGATTGTVQVVLPSGTLSSNIPFYVLQ